MFYSNTYIKILFLAEFDYVESRHDNSVCTVEFSQFYDRQYSKIFILSVVQVYGLLLSSGPIKRSLLLLFCDHNIFYSYSAFFECSFLIHIHFGKQQYSVVFNKGELGSMLLLFSKDTTSALPLSCIL